MTIPTTFFGVAVIISLVVPGIVFAAVRTSLQGYLPSDRNVSSRLVQAVMLSVLLDAVYLLVFGNWIAGLLQKGKSLVLLDPTEVGAATLFFGIVVPALVAYVLYGQTKLVSQCRNFITARRPNWMAWISTNSRYRRAPTAWDWVAGTKANTWIRILTANGKWIGGWFTDDSYFAAYPEPRDVFIPLQWRMNDDGSFADEGVQNSAGVWVNLEGAQLVEWIYAEALTTSEDYDDVE